MSRGAGRLNLRGALNRSIAPSHLNLLTAEPTLPRASARQASVCRLERELMGVKEENNRLRVQLEETRSALQELTSEASLEKYDERRINLLKMQIIQLQRQVLLMSEALGSRSTVLMEVENALTWLSEKFRYFIGLDIKGADIPVPRSDLTTMVDTSESARIKLFKNIENCSKENLSQPQMLMNAFLKPGQEKDFTMLDCCLGRVDCLNLKHVAQLESKLSRLYKELIKVSEYLTGSVDHSRQQQQQDSRETAGVTGGHMSGAVCERRGTVVLRACAMSRDCAADLLSLSLLFPAAPWPVLKKPAVTDVTYESLAPALPSLTRGKAAEVQRCVTAALKACNHRCHMVTQEAAALREEVRFHQAIYQLQLSYVLQAFEALRQGYSEFEHSTSELLIQPMKKLLEAYRKLKNNTSHEGLKEFLTILRQQEHQWEDIIQKLDITESESQSGSSALSAFGEEFLSSLDRLVLSQQKQRDKASSQKDDLKAAQRRLEDELHAIISDREEQLNIAREIKRQALRTNADTENNSKTELERPTLSSDRSSSRAADVSVETGEGNTGLRPWLDNPNINASRDGKKGMKPRRESMTVRTPWQDVFNERNGTAEAAALWSDRSQSASSKEAGREAITGLRPWLDEQIIEERNSVMERKNRELTRVHESSVYDCESSHSLGHQDGVESKRTSERLSELPTDKQQEPSILSHRTNQFPLQPRSRNTSAKEFPSQPPVPTGSLSRLPPDRSQKTKCQTKLRNYEPKLYVANRTLSLRRSGSLSRLSEPSLQGQMAKMSLAGQQALENTRVKSDFTSE